MLSLNELIKASKKTCDSRPIKVCILGNCSTQFLAKAIKGYGITEGLNIITYDADYDQITGQILDSSSEMYTFKPDIIVLYMCSEKLYEEFCDDNAPERFAEKTINTISNYYDRITSNCDAKIIQFNFAEIGDNIFGNYGAKTQASFTYQTRKLNYLLQEEMNGRKNVFPLDLLGIQNRIGYCQLFPPVQYHSSKLTIDLKYIPLAAKNIIDIIKAMNGYVKKCIITDLDNTLWGGNAGDRDPGELEIGSVGRGHAFTDFQRYIRKLKDRGIILAVCSKNNEENAKRPFECLEDMELKLSDFLIFTANWEDKAANIRNIVRSLNISADSVVFIDDNVFERNAVKNLLPDISVPDMPEDPAEYINTLKEYNYFETTSYSDDDIKRTELYQTEFKRKESIADFADYDDYLRSLEMQAEAVPFDELRSARVAELSQRSNQFNLRTIRYTEDDIRRIADDKDYFTLCISLKDKYGSYGLISAVIMKKISNDTLFVDTWILSCRVLKRGVEEFIINNIIKTAKEKGFKYVEAEYILTAKNAMVRDIYGKYGFSAVKGNYFRIDVSDYEEHPCHITAVSPEVKI